MHPPTFPLSSNQVLDFLSELFPGFRESWDEDENPYINPDGRFSIHSVFIEFTDFFGRYVQNPEKPRLVALANFINQGMAADPSFENAVSTCFLEHLHQIRAKKILKPFLGPQAKSQLRS